MQKHQSVSFPDCHWLLVMLSSRVRELITCTSASGSVRVSSQGSRRMNSCRWLSCSNRAGSTMGLSSSRWNVLLGRMSGGWLSKLSRMSAAVQEEKRHQSIITYDLNWSMKFDVDSLCLFYLGLWGVNKAQNWCCWNQISQQIAISLSKVRGENRTGEGAANLLGEVKVCWCWLMEDYSRAVCPH